jgi:hypothetical protein
MACQVSRSRREEAVGGTEDGGDGFWRDEVGERKWEIAPGERCILEIGWREIERNGTLNS